MSEMQPFVLAIPQDGEARLRLEGAARHPWLRDCLTGGHQLRFPRVGSSHEPD